MNNLAAVFRKRGRAPWAHIRSISWGSKFIQGSASTPDTVRRSNIRETPESPDGQPRERHRDTKPLRGKHDRARSAKLEPYPPRPASRPSPTPYEHIAHRAAMKRRFPEGWAPPRTISRETMTVLRDLHASDRVRYRTPVLADMFRISPEAVSRILKSKWRPSPERLAKMIAKEKKEKDMLVAEKIETRRAEVQGHLGSTETRL